MLVLQRKVDQTIKIGDDITIQVVKVSGSKVKLAIDAPLYISVLRGEIDDSGCTTSEASGSDAGRSPSTNTKREPTVVSIQGPLG